MTALKRCRGGVIGVNRRVVSMTTMYWEGGLYRILSGPVAGTEAKSMGDIMAILGKSGKCAGKVGRKTRDAGMLLGGLKVR